MPSCIQSSPLEGRRCCLARQSLSTECLLPLLSALSNADPAPVPWSRVAARPLTDLKANPAGRAARGPGGPWCPSSISNKQGGKGEVRKQERWVNPASRYWLTSPRVAAPKSHWDMSLKDVLHVNQTKPRQGFRKGFCRCVWLWLISVPTKC